MRSWYNEVAYYNWADPGWRASTGHFTQLVWDDTARLGCALNAACKQATYVCHYSPVGARVAGAQSSRMGPVHRAGAPVRELAGCILSK